jgi:hypothetical protein
MSLIGADLSRTIPTRMMRTLAATSLALVSFIACSTRVPAAAVAWSERAPVLGPATTAVGKEGAQGYLRVETDQDVRVNGSLAYDYPRRPFDLYGADGTLLRADVDNQGWLHGQDPVSVELEPGRYVVASVWGTVYRKVQVEVRSGLTTEVPASVLKDAPRVFDR